MARRKTSPLEDFVEIVAMMPWWAGVMVAMVAYLVLSHYATQPVAPIAYTPGQPPNITAQIFKGLAAMLQYGLPLLALVGAALSFFKRRKRGALFNVVANSGKNILDGISWQEFEMLVGESFRRKGYTVEENGGAGADGGVDLILYKGGEKSFVQCKQWRSYKVGVKVVRELYGVMAADGAASGYVVTSGRFTRDAVEFAKGREINLIDGEKLNRMIRETKQQRKPVSTVIAVVKEEPGGMVINANIPECPKCGAQMVRRIARKGSYEGQLFWGCQSFPNCRGVRPLS